MEPNIIRQISVQEMHTSEAGSVGGISLGETTDIHAYPRGTMNVQVYKDDIPDAYVRLYAGAKGDAFLLQTTRQDHTELAS